jgi:hypothetical protein
VRDIVEDKKVLLDKVDDAGSSPTNHKWRKTSHTSTHFEEGVSHKSFEKNCN